MKPKKIVSLFLAFVCFFSAVFPFSSIAASSLSEYEVKAAFVYQFTKFMEWPQPADFSNQFTICVVGEHSFQRAFQQLENELVKDQAAKVKMALDLDELDSCQIIFISSSENARTSQILRRVSDKSILTVGEMQGFLEKGGIINFTKEGSKIRFGVNQKSAERVGIKISSKLLTIASQVIS